MSSEVPTPSKSKEPARKSGDPRPESVCIPEKPAIPAGEPRGKEETGKRKAEEESGTLSTVEGCGQVARRVHNSTLEDETEDDDSDEECRA